MSSIQDVAYKLGMWNALVKLDLGGTYRLSAKDLVAYNRLARLTGHGSSVSNSGVLPNVCSDLMQDVER